MEKIFCDYYKDTANWYRWDAKIDDTLLEIYLPKWRVPDPYPLRISMEIYEPSEYRRPIVPLDQEEALANPRLRRAPIVAEVTFTNKDRSPKVEYGPVLNDNVREIGDLFIPKTLLAGLTPKRLVIVIDWETVKKDYHNSTY
jgi:hypothetical protein